MNAEAHRLIYLYEVIRRAERARRHWNLRDRRERKDFERQAYQPRLDYGEQTDLKPGYHVEGDEGWMD